MAACGDRGQTPVARCARCDVTKAFGKTADRDRWATEHAEAQQHTVLTWGETWRAFSAAMAS